MNWIPLADDPRAYLANGQDLKYAKARVWLEPWTTVELALGAHSTDYNLMNFQYRISASSTLGKDVCTTGSLPSANEPSTGNIVINGFK